MVISLDVPFSDVGFAVTLVGGIVRFGCDIHALSTCLINEGGQGFPLSNPGQRRLERWKRDRTFKLINRSPYQSMLHVFTATQPQFIKCYTDHVVSSRACIRPATLSVNCLAQ